MNYKPIPVTDRILTARKTVKDSVVGSETNPYKGGEYKMFGTGDRYITLGFLEGWNKHKDAHTTKLRRSLSEAEELYAAEPIIYGSDLLCGRLYLPHMSPEEQEHYNALCDSFESSCFPLRIEKARKDHIGLDFYKLLNKGIDQIIEELKSKLSEINSRTGLMDESYILIESEEFCQCCIVELEAVLDLAERYANHAMQLAENAVGNRRNELLRMAAAMKNVPAKPANSFFEAVQSVHFFLSNLFGLYPLGRPDRYLLPYYEKDIASGKITREEAQELIDFLCIGISDRVFSRAACGFMVGGQTSNGEPVENELTYMFITALDHIRMSDPNGAIAINSKTSNDLIEYATEILGKGVSHPAFFNDDEIVASLRKMGISDEDSVNYIHSTCAEITVAGRSKGHTTSFSVDLPRMLYEIVEQNTNIADFEQLMNSINERLRKEVINRSRHYEYKLLEAARNGNDPMRICCFVDDCMERCRGLYDFGPRYIFHQPIFIGFSTLVDSLTAIKILCFEEKRLSLCEFLSIVENNYNENEALRQYIINRLPHYGNDIEEPDSIAAKIAEFIESNSYCKISEGQYLVPGTFSYVTHASSGHNMKATFDGRKAGMSYSDGCSPVQGRDINGPTAMINSLTSWNQSKFLSGMVVNIKFSKSNFDTNKRHLLVNVIRSFMKQGGIEIQVNAVERATLEDAKIHPEDHRDLIVRIGGYSDYFVRLSPTLQQEIIERTQY